MCQWKSTCAALADDAFDVPCSYFLLLLSLSDCPISAVRTSHRETTTTTNHHFLKKNCKTIAMTAKALQSLRVPLGGIHRSVGGVQVRLQLVSCELPQRFTFSTFFPAAPVVFAVSGLERKHHRLFRRQHPPMSHQWTFQGTNWRHPLRGTVRTRQSVTSTFDCLLSHLLFLLFSPLFSCDP